MLKKFFKTYSHDENEIITESSVSSHSNSDPEVMKILSSSLIRDAGISLEPLDERFPDSYDNNGQTYEQ